MKAFIAVNTFLKGQPIYCGETIEVAGYDDELLKELQACGKIDKREPFKEIQKGAEAIRAEGDAAKLKALAEDNAKLKTELEAAAKKK